MSIASEIGRLQKAKTDLKAVIEERGIKLEDNMLISDYPQVASSIPYVVSGLLTPEEDTPVFALSGLSFTPTGVLLSCTELQASGVAGGVFSGFLYRGEESSMNFFNTTTNETTMARIGPTSNILEWSADGFKVTFPSGTAALKKGYTYKYILIGGNS